MWRNTSPLFQRRSRQRIRVKCAEHHAPAFARLRHSQCGIFNALIIVFLIPLALKGVSLNRLPLLPCCAVTYGFTVWVAAGAVYWYQSH